jgi:sec-independent protein translocase protein TatC
LSRSTRHHIPPHDPTGMRRKNDDDLFQESTMSFGEHLDELRTALLRSLKWLVLGCSIGLYYGNHVVEFIKKPLSEALEKYYREKDGESKGIYSRSQRQAMRELGLVPVRYYFDREVLTATLENRQPNVVFKLPDEDPIIPDLAKDARDEVRSIERVIRANRRVQELLPEDLRGMIDCRPSIGAEKLFSKFVAQTNAMSEILRRRDFYTTDAFPYLSDKQRDIAETLAHRPNSEIVAFNRELLGMAHPDSRLTIYPDLVAISFYKHIEDDERLQPKSMNTQEPFMIYIKGSFLLGFILASPMVFYHMWNFVAAGLYPHEKNYVHIFLPVSIGLFLAGAGIAFFLVFQFVLDFLLGFNKWLGIAPELRMSEWLPFALMLPIGFGVSFQLPLVMLFLERIGVFDVDSYVKKWRIAVLVIFIIAAILTPADPYSMMLMAGPLTVLYFLGILMCKWWPKVMPTDSRLATV